MPALPESLTLRDGIVVLRDWRDEDASALEPVCGDVDVCQFTSVPSTYTRSAAGAWVRRQRDHRAAGTGLVLAITRDGEDAALGNVNLVRFSDDGRDAALGYWLVGHGHLLPARRVATAVRRRPHGLAGCRRGGGLTVAHPPPMSSK